MTVTRKYPLVLVCLAVLTLGLGACGDDDDDDGSSGGGSLSSNCASACVSADALQCSGDTEDCRAGCENAVDEAPGCEAQFEAYVACAAGRPASDWECDEDDESDLKDGVCSAETGALGACFLSL